ncbi:MAG: hypothetical protein IKS46_03755 [Clostridia bacterium]|nr:hypothetical protein [Clostridia bacterium]
MKKLLCICLCVMVCLVPAVSFCDEGDLFPADIMLLMSGGAGKAEVSDSLEGYSPFNEKIEDIDRNFVVLILQREAPKKEFTEKKVYPPFENKDGFDESFTGVDIGKERVWLRGDLMAQVPDLFAAGSFDEANYLIVGETMYIWDGTISQADYKNSGEELPEFESTEEMIAYFLDHPREVESMTYYPKFGCYMLVALYERESQKASVMDYNYIPSMRFARNPEAAEQWTRMEYLVDALDALEAEEPDADKVQEAFGNLEFVQDQDLWSEWAAAIEDGEYAAAAGSIGEYLWGMAKDLREMDPSEENRENYDLIIGEENRLALGLFANYCDYSGFERPISDIEESGDYIATPDEEWMEKALQEVVELFRQ